MFFWYFQPPYDIENFPLSILKGLYKYKWLFFLSLCLEVMVVMAVAMCAADKNMHFIDIFAVTYSPWRFTYIKHSYVDSHVTSTNTG